MDNVPFYIRVWKLLNHTYGVVYAVLLIRFSKLSLFFQL